MDDKMETASEEPEKTVKEGAEKTVKEGAEKIVKEGPEKTVKEGAEKTVKEGPEKTVKEEPELGEHLKGVPESVLRFLEMEEIRMESPMPKVEIDSLSTRSYLDHTVVPVIMDAMVAVAKLRPPDPIEYVSMFILKNKDKYKRY